jgi:hypothetical protein
MAYGACGEGRQTYATYRDSRRGREYRGLGVAKQTLALTGGLRQPWRPFHSEVCLEIVQGAVG